MSPSIWIEKTCFGIKKITTTVTVKLHVSCGRKVVDMNDLFHPYLERIYQDVMFKDIVGKHAMVGSLHYNRLLSFRSFKEAMLQNLTAEQKTISKELAERFPDTSTPQINKTTIQISSSKTLERR